MIQPRQFSRIIFWNVNNNDLTNLVCSLANSTMADVVVLNENEVPVDATLRALRQHVSAEFFVPNASSEKRFHCFCRNRALDMSEVHSGFRTSVRDFKIGSQRALLALVQGMSL